MPDKLWENLISNGGLACVAIALIWRAPTLIRVFMDGKKEVADVMHQQSALFGGMIDKYDNRLKDVEDNLTTLTQAVKENQEGIKALLDEIKVKGK
jgi:hypothetical protein